MALKPVYNTSTTVTITLDSLADGGARESAEIDNTTNRYLDAHLRASIAVGTTSGEERIAIYVWGSEDGSVRPQTISGSDADITLESPIGLKLAHSLPVPTNSVTVESDVIPIAWLFGGTLPRKWGVVIQNKSGAALSASGHSVKYTGIGLENV